MSITLAIMPGTGRVPASSVSRMSTTATVLAIASAGGNGRSHSGLYPLIIGIVFVATGVLNAVDPRLQWRMRSWQYKNKEALEPSDTALTVGRVVGVIAVGVGIVLIVVGITKLS